jgi:hypothetical protein
MELNIWQETMRMRQMTWGPAGFTSIILLIAGVFTPPSVYAHPVKKNTSCVPNQAASIQSITHCTDEPGFAVFAGGDEISDSDGWKDTRIQNVCGPGGRLTRLQAWSSWLKQVQDFQDQCEVNGGEFAYMDSGFTEPKDDSFCLPPQLQKGYTSLEDPTINVIAACPAVHVSCRYTCNADKDETDPLLVQETTQALISLKSNQ